VIHSLIPGVGEAYDLAVVLHPDSTVLDRSLAGGSLTINVFSAGLLPNLGPFLVRSGGNLVRSVSVIGHYPDYIQLAEKLGANRFNIPGNVWDKMTEVQRWTANRKFLDRAVRRGDIFELATPLEKIRPGSYLEKEINYLLEQGYQLSTDGTKLLPPSL
jgi:hypothetical protein